MSTKIQRSFLITEKTLAMLIDMAERLSKETGIKMSLNYCVELSIKHCSKMPLARLKDNSLSKQRFSYSDDK